ncbi:MAG: hypothetical protein HQL61_09755 [Magnetococcales bacterium]|uniref:Uncharacterized protein n=1 Tax=Candidatus Magnetobacterium casense TaxID=1455061 RepID=A0ABS6RW49_9BACT|nr:hypothetical protein [Candidatus Magnetobacterium casensis]MBF0607816.1 hypothetical protein [Nitrospirota bacterium]MBV6340672.1 hypothetical protein [Candidatus Magnetobacterium casensis]
MAARCWLTSGKIIDRRPGDWWPWWPDGGQWWQAGGRMTCATSLVSAVSGQCMGANVRLVPGLA